MCLKSLFHLDAVKVAIGSLKRAFLEDPNCNVNIICLSCDKNVNVFACSLKYNPAANMLGFI